MFRQHQLSVLKTFSLEPELQRASCVSPIHGQGEGAPPATGGQTVSLGLCERMAEALTWVSVTTEGLLSSLAPRDGELGLRAKVVYKHGKDSRRYAGGIERETGRRMAEGYLWGFWPEQDGCESWERGTSLSRKLKIT